GPHRLPLCPWARDADLHHGRDRTRRAGRGVDAGQRRFAFGQSPRLVGAQGIDRGETLECRGIALRPAGTVPPMRTLSPAPPRTWPSGGGDAPALAMSKLPLPFSVPPVTRSPAFFSTGIASPVSIDSSIAGIVSVLPSDKTLRAIFGARSSRARMAPPVFSR